MLKVALNTINKSINHYCLFLDILATTTLSTTTVSCTDSGVWILDGIVSCDYLEKPSGYGIHNNPAGFCQQHHKECCKTCNKLKQVNIQWYSLLDVALFSATIKHIFKKIIFLSLQRNTLELSRQCGDVLLFTLVFHIESLSCFGTAMVY